ncbi:MAG: anti-phage defense-associated sirtuin Dsr1 [Nitrospiraceae bacterium]
MPRFVSNGPDIPERLLWRHEEGKVVFFCGAGISYPAGLPDFKGLVEQIYDDLGTTRNPIEENAFANFQYDATLDLLERRIPGNRQAVRSALAKVLKPKWRRKGATETHKALLQLAEDWKGKVRLVTTNFDQIFERVRTQCSPPPPSFAAPLLPIPKPTRWHGVIHIHGLLPNIIDEISLNRLVLTSGDFGLAYLTERWAARFVSELFRYYTVCFVGYSINDPVLRYMMDALAVDQMLGEVRPEAFAFGHYETGDEALASPEWQAKGVIPLLYEIPSGTHDHSALHLTLKHWAETYRDGVSGKEMIVTQHASTPPLTSSRLDYAVGRTLWALTDGLAAKHFADLNPVPPLEWLEPLSQDQFKHEDLSRFGVTPNQEINEKLVFSFFRRPSPYTLAPHMCLVDIGPSSSNWDEVMFHLGRWLTRHLDDPKLVLWIAKQGGQLHHRFTAQIQQQLMDLDRLSHDNNQGELNRIRSNAPNAIPSPLMRILWRLVLSGRLESRERYYDLYGWVRRFKLDGLTPTLRLELREALTPRVTIREPFRWTETPDTIREVKRISDLVEWEIVLSAGHLHSILRDAQRLPSWSIALPGLLQDFSLLLRDTFDLMHELGAADEKSDHSYSYQPSISKHPQNNDFHDWAGLIILTRDAWVAVFELNSKEAQRTAESWWQTPYPLFRRLAFFAATHGNVISPRQALDWLLAENGWWLWSSETQREAIRLLVALAPRLDATDLSKLEQAILLGPPRDMYRPDIEQEEWIHRQDADTWLRLKKAHTAGATLGPAGAQRLSDLSQKYPRWKLASDERDEFPFWIGTGDGDELGQPPLVVPTQHHKVVAWLKEHPSSDHGQKDDWQQRCRDRFPTATCALYALSSEGQWPTDRWREALQAWAEEGLLKKSWRFVAKVIGVAPDPIVRNLKHPLSWFLKAQAKTFVSHETQFFSLSGRLLELDCVGDLTTDDDPVSRAINHPIGHTTEALLYWWYRQNPREGQSLPEKVKSLFTSVCDTQVSNYRHGRVILAAHVIALFRADEEWTKTYLLPIFDWNKSEVEAGAAWEGFLWSPRLYGPLLLALKPSMIAAASHYVRLGKHAEQFAAFLTFAALDPGEIFTTNELAQATRALPLEGLQSAAQTLVRALEGAGDQREAYWHNRVLPYWKSIWPKSTQVNSPAISENLARLCVTTKKVFLESLKELRHWLQPIQYPDYILSQLHETEICREYPNDALEFLGIIVGDSAQWISGELQECLNQINQANHKLANKPAFVRLTKLVKRYGNS